MINPRVSIAHCTDYDEERVYAAVKTAINHALPGGLRTLLAPGSTAALKVNMILPKIPEQWSTTHPSVVKAICRLVAECGANSLIIDSPGGPYTPALLQVAYDRCGFTTVAAQTQATLNFDTTVTTVCGSTGTPLQRADLLWPAVKADIIINLPKLKTHGLTTMTCAVKNMFGLIAGMQKIEYHMRSPELFDFCSMLVGIAELAGPELTLVDGIVAMEGDGPTGGRGHELGVILCGQNMHAVDIVAATLMGVRPEHVPTISQAHKAGLCSLDVGDIEVLGPTTPAHHFELSRASVRTHLLDRFLPPAWADKVSTVLRPQPRVKRATCTGCGACVRHCPPQAISLKKGDIPHITFDRCIRCFCCQELCPQHAIDVQRTWLGRALFR